MDIHAQNSSGITFKYLDGTQEIHLDGEVTHGRWRDERAQDPKFYSIPFRSLQPKGWDNILVAGRCLDADEGAFGAVRVMITCNQMGEAAGEAVALAHQTEQNSFQDLNVHALKQQMNDGGSLLQGLSDQ